MSQGIPEKPRVSSRSIIPLSAQCVSGITPYITFFPGKSDKGKKDVHKSKLYYTKTLDKRKY